MSSSTGTYVNGEKISGEHPLSDGDRVCLGPPGSKGSDKLLVRVPQGTAAPADAAIPEFSLSGDDGPSLLEPSDSFSLETEASAPEIETVPPLELEAPYAAPPVAIRAPDPEPPAPAPQPAAEPKLTAPAPARKPGKADYTTDMPSIAAPERPREAVVLPPVPKEIPRAKKAKRSGFDLKAVPLPALAGVGVLVLALGAWTVYSRMQGPPPVIETISPPKVETGGTVTISGTGFDSSATGNVVRFGDQTGTVVSASDKQIAVTVPNVESGDRAVTVTSRRSRSNQLVVKIFKAPAISKLEPDVALPGEE